MKIKRFEASNMSDALRAVKKEFGDEAVILSAKNIRKTSRLFSSKNRGQVVVTAAIDRNATAKATNVSNQKANQGGSHDMKSLFTNRNPADTDPTATGIAPITKTGQKKLKSKFIRLASEVQKPKQRHFVKHKMLYERLIDQGLETSLAHEWSEQVRRLSFTSPETQNENDERVALSHVINAANLIAPLKPGSAEKQRRVVLVGPSGSGKTTMAAKIAASAIMQDQTAAVISLDNFRIAGTEELQRYARIIGFEFEALSNADEIQDALYRHRDAKLIIVDTPGMGINDGATRSKVSELLAMIKDAEVHLLLNACYQRPVLDSVIQFFKPLRVERLLYTHLDWTHQKGEVLNTSVSSGTPISYVSDGSGVPDGFQIATAERLASLLCPDLEASGNDIPITVVRTPQRKNGRDNFLANRNSDIFHRSTCRSVKRINNDNILVFESQMDAMAQNFKPCRMCCADLLATKPFKATAYRTLERGGYR
jgi:flagellar biosynthetic protein FlhF